MHCDVDQDNSTRRIRQCIEDIAVDRIDHGVNILDDEALFGLALAKGLGFTVCPVSNACVTGDTRSTHVRRMLRKGLQVTVNSDDPAYFGGCITENLLAVHHAVGLSEGEVAQLARNAIDLAWLPRRSKDVLLGCLEAFRADWAAAQPQSTVVRAGGRCLQTRIRRVQAADRAGLLRWCVAPS